MEKMRKQFLKLLNIHGVSGKEENVRKYLQKVLVHQMDSVDVDAYGNLLATKKYGNGEGATILLSSHMDTVTGVLADRKVLENNGIITSDKGALGADDRGGIAIILEVLRQIDNIEFNGTIKIAFSREEEIGCIGSNQINKSFYEGADLAIIVDRRGNRDIVVGCGQAFCSNEVGRFFEEVSKMQDMNWECVEGGISDAFTFSGNGINSVNLSAGYMNEHTDKEYAVLTDMYDTVKLILQSFAVINDICHTFTSVPEENDWVQAWSYGSGYNKYYTPRNAGTYFEDNFDDYVYAEEFDENGDVYIYEIGSDIAIQQDDKEILISRSTMKSLVNKLKKLL